MNIVGGLMQSVGLNRIIEPGETRSRVVSQLTLIARRCRRHRRQPAVRSSFVLSQLCLCGGG